MQHRKPASTPQGSGLFCCLFPCLYQHLNLVAIQAVGSWCKLEVDVGTISISNASERMSNVARLHLAAMVLSGRGHEKDSFDLILCASAASL
jgi:hypothetical protein